MKLPTSRVIHCVAILVAGLGIASVAHPESDPKPPEADPSIWMVRSYGNHRIVIQRVCNPAHCSTLGFLEVLTQGNPPKVVASVAIKELNSKWWAFVERIEIIPGDDYHFDLFAVDTHGTEAGFTLRITPGAGSKYEADVRDFRSGADVP